jgi:hypothetical protein
MKTIDRRTELLRERAAEFADVAVRNVQREFPYDMRLVMRHPGDFPDKPSELYPVFCGAFDWHSCVEMHWVLVRLLRTVPELLPDAAIRAVLDRLMTGHNFAVEAATFAERPHGSRPYGWGWALALITELAGWDDPDGRRWAVNAAPLGVAIEEAFLRWLPNADYPVRTGMHNNSAFALSRALPYARARAVGGQPALLDAISEAADRWFGLDVGYPGNWEPSGSDFLSPALAEAELMGELLEPERFLSWLNAFFPALSTGQPGALFLPVTVSDDSDEQIGHLHGLNLSRAWGWRRLAEFLPEGDARRAVLFDTAARHADPEMEKVSGSGYLVEHWLACYAVLYLT